MSIYRLKTSWIGPFPGLPGYTFVYTSGPNLQPSQLAIFWDAIKQFFPLQLKWHVDPNITTIDEVTGKMTASTPGDAPVDVAATGSANFVPQAGAQLKLYTQGFANGRHVVGRWFLVPMITSSWTTNGLLLAATCNSINAAADVLRSSSGQTLCVWHRPVYKKAPVEGDPPVLVRPGAAYGVTSTAVPTKSVTLNSRRD